MPIIFGRVFSFLERRRGGYGVMIRGWLAFWELGWGGIYDWMMLGYGISSLFLFGLNWSSYSNTTMTGPLSLFITEAHPCPYITPVQYP